MNWNIGSLQCHLHQVTIPAKVEPNVRQPDPDPILNNAQVLYTTLKIPNASPMHWTPNVLISRSAKCALARCQTPLPSISAFISSFVVAIPFVIATGLSIEEVSFGVDFLSRPEVVDAEDDCVAPALHEGDLLLVFSLVI